MNLNLRRIAVVSALSAPLASFAAIPEAVTTAVTAAQTDGTTAAGLMIGLMVIVFLGFKILKRVFGG